jgi:hypothetical protein
LKQIVISLIAALSLSACLIKDEVQDGLWEISTTVSTATLTVSSEGAAEVEFTFNYLLGLVDSQGIEQVEWTYALLDREGSQIVSETQVMREPELDKREIFVQGDRPRVLSLESGQVAAEGRYILWILVQYRETTLTEVLIPVSVDEPYSNEVPPEDIPQFSTR